SFLELRLRELLELADRARHLRAVRRREFDDSLAVDLVLLLQADVARVGNENVDVLLTFDAHSAVRLLGSGHRMADVRSPSATLPHPTGGGRKAPRPSHRTIAN